MSGIGLFDFDERCHQLHKLGNPLERLDKAINWEKFRPLLKKVHEKERKNNSGRKPWDVVLMFKTLVLQSMYNLSDDQTEYQVRDRISFMQFLGLQLGDQVPDAKTVWLFRDQLRNLGLVERLFKRFDRYLTAQGYEAKGGTIVDASIVEVPKQRNSREDNRELKVGRVPKSFRDNPAKARQKDTEARWVKKNGENYYGYKNHVNVDARHKFIRAYGVTDAATHDSQMMENLMGKAKNTNKNVYGDSAYRSNEITEMLAQQNLRDKIHRKSYRGNPLKESAKAANANKSKIRARVEHVFGRQKQFGETIIRSIGKARAKCWIGLRNLVYNFDRYAGMVT
jgi:IS5 family transposase|tara:strand:+ start:25 stop:1041 length:1017 start_codon:yes stop_codon:yes gene_type:complete